MHNPYSPPSAKVADVGIDAAKGSGVKAVLIGLLIDLGGSIVIGIVLTVIYSFQLAAAGLDEDEIMAAMSNIPFDSWVFIAGAIIGCFCSILGGYVCARIARHSEYKFGNILSAISIIVGSLMVIEAYSLFAIFVLALMTWASVMVGVRLGVSRNRLA